LEIAFESLEFGVSRHQHWVSLCRASWLELLHSFVLDYEICELEQEGFCEYEIAVSAGGISGRGIETARNLYVSSAAGSVPLAWSACKIKSIWMGKMGKPLVGPDRNVSF
jgi:hypothetical protein